MELLKYALASFRDCMISHFLLHCFYFMYFSLYISTSFVFLIPVASGACFTLKNVGTSLISLSRHRRLTLVQGHVRQPSTSADASD